MKKKFTTTHGIFLLLMLWCTAMHLVSCKKHEEPAPIPPEAKDTSFIRGVDLSFTPEISSAGTQFTADGATLPLLTIIKNKGINTVRLRLWNHPVNEHSGLQEVTTFGGEIKSEGLKFWLDFHYSDTWADPGHQTKPAAWSSLSTSQLDDSIYYYTKNALQYLVQNNATPDYIQVGNEINSGILWNDGKVNSATDANWTNLSQLLSKAIQAVRETCPHAKIIIHFSGIDYAQEFFTAVTNHGIDFDLIGLSYYPWWHGSDLASAQSSIQSLQSMFNKPVIIAETAYPFTLGWNDYTFNSVGDSSQCISGYLPSPEGQAGFISKLIDMVRSQYNGDHAGVCYWAPDWVAFKGPTATDGSSWENLTLFNFQNQSLPALDSLGKH